MTIIVIFLLIPPFALTFSRSSSSLLGQATNWDANASLISKKWISPNYKSTTLTTTGIAMAGPTPMITGSTPMAVKVLNTPRMGSPFCTAMLLFMKRTYPAPSLTWQELPALVLPSLKTGCSSTRSKNPGSVPDLTICCLVVGQ